MYIICERDRAVSAPAQPGSVASLAINVDAHGLEAGRCPVVSILDEVAELIRRAAGNEAVMEAARCFEP